MDSELLYEELLYFERQVTNLEIELFAKPKYWSFIPILQMNIRDILKLRIKIENDEKNRFYLSELNNLYKRLLSIHDIAYANNCDISLGQYLNDQASITHLVYTNNKCSNIKLYSDFGFIFLCQFHRENTPSFGVREDIGHGYCFGCGCSFHAVQYLMEFEDLTYQEAVRLLSKIYLVDISGNPVQENSPLVIKYRNTLLSDDFKVLLAKGYSRTIKKEITSEVLDSIQKFDHDLATIERVKRHGHIRFDNRNKKYFLKIPDFNQSMGE